MLSRLRVRWASKNPSGGEGEGEGLRIKRGRDGDIATLAIPSTNGHDFIPVEIDPDRRVIRTQSGLVIDRSTFRFMRDTWGAILLADDPELIILLLGLSRDDRGVVAREGIELIA